jgi:predicted SAM-dependent methyltransferase
MMEKAEGRVLDVGCGRRKIAGAIGVDRFAVEGVDVVQDLDTFPYPFKSDTFREIHARHVIEHVRSVSCFLDELHRVLSRSGRLIITTPRAELRWDFLEAIWSRTRRESLEFNHCPISPQRLKWALLKKGFTIKTFERFLFGCELFVDAAKELGL